MKVRNLMMVGVGVVLGVAAWSLAPELTAQADGTSRVCNATSLRGDYGLLVSGVRGVPPMMGGGTERFVATALWSFDGKGGIVQSGGSIHGEIMGVVHDPGDVIGTYEVNPSCTGSFTLYFPQAPYPVEHSFVIVDAGREIKAATMSPLSNVATVSLTRK